MGVGLGRALWRGQGPHPHPWDRPPRARVPPETRTSSLQGPESPPPRPGQDPPPPKGIRAPLAGITPNPPEPGTTTWTRTTLSQGEGTPPAPRHPPSKGLKPSPDPPPTPDQDPPVPGPHTRSAGSRTGRSRAGRGRVPAAATEQRSRAVGPRESHPDLVGAASSSTAGPTSAPGEPRYGGHCAATWRTHAGRMSCSAQAQA